MSSDITTPIESFIRTEPGTGGSEREVTPRGPTGDSQRCRVGAIPALTRVHRGKDT